MKKELLNWLACPSCSDALVLKDILQSEGEVKSGYLLCVGCGKKYPIINFIPRFVDCDKYVDNFSFEWRVHSKTQVDSFTGGHDSYNTFIEKTGLKKEEIENKLVLDVGCGTGRFIEIAQSFGGIVIGIDLSFAIDVAFENMGLRPNVHLAQADIERLPFKSETFDVIYSIGVLHHTPNTMKSFEKLVPFLKQKGILSIWVYSSEGKLHFVSDFLRKITTIMPRRFLYYLCVTFVPLILFFRRIPILSLPFRLIPISDQRKGLKWDILDTFDWYSPKYQWKHTEEDVKEWFEKNGFSEIEILAFPVSVRGRKGV